MTAVKAPCAADDVEPDTGDRMYLTPIVDIASATRREAFGETVLISTNICEACSVSFSPPALKTMSSSAASSLMAETTILALATTPPISGSLRRFARAARSRRSGLRVSVVTANPWAASRSQMGRPILPRPIQPIRHLSNTDAALIFLPLRVAALRQRTGRWRQ
jgi:hypothetical protein